jgi:hypothetical protein
MIQDSMKKRMSIKYFSTCKSNCREHYFVRNVHLFPWNVSFVVGTISNTRVFSSILYLIRNTVLLCVFSWNVELCLILQLVRTDSWFPSRDRFSSVWNSCNIIHHFLEFSGPSENSKSLHLLWRAHRVTHK